MGGKRHHATSAMNDRQEAFYRQARSDWSVFRHFHPHGPGWLTLARQSWCGIVGVHPFLFAPCHELHYLQMATEKLAKAYHQTDLRQGHAAFQRLLADLPNNSLAVAPLGFRDRTSLSRWQGSVIPIVIAIENLAPSIADRQGLPNPEYPWPRGAEVSAPVDHSFQVEVFSLLDRQIRSGEPGFLTVLDKMFATMQSAAWHL